MVNKIQSNTVGLSVAAETTIGVLPVTPVWTPVEANSYSDFGATIATVARNTLNASRQRQKGTVTDVDAKVGISHDLQTLTLVRMLQSFFFAAARQKADTQPLDTTAVAMTACTATTYTAAAGLGVFIAKNIVLASGFGVAANNGLKVLSAAAAGTLTTAGNAIEATPPAAARVRCVGVEFASADIDVAVVGTTAVNLVSTVFDFTTLGLIVGEWVFVGGDLAANRFTNNVGYARISAIAAHTLSFDQTNWTAVNEVGTAKLIRMFYGTVLRNEKTSSLIVTKSLQFERTLGDAGSGVQSQYLVGAVGNELTINVPKGAKATVDMSFIGLDSEERTGAEGVKAGTRADLVAEAAYNTTSDVVRQRVAVADATSINNAALVGYVSDATVKISNGVTPDKALGVMGGFDVSYGDFVVGGTVTAYFTDIAAVTAVRNNADLNYNLILARANQGMVYDMPLCSAGGGRANVEKDKAIMLPLENSAFEGSAGYTLMNCIFPYLPTVAMAA